MNFAFFYQVNVLYYETSWDTSLQLYFYMVTDIFGTCVQAYGDECSPWPAAA